jgi:4-hydroxy-2-oxoheptanedioate aldolase
MDLPVNTFKRRLLVGERQVGLWLSLSDPVSTELAAGAGFDWLCIDAEHSPTDLRTLLVQLQAASAYPCAMLVRMPWGDRVMIKQYLDLGFQTLVVPMVESAEQAAHIVESMRYPGTGLEGGARGVVNVTRAGRWGRVPDYLKRAHEELCLIVQIETAKGVDNIEAIAAVPGVDSLFIGPGDLAASLGHIGEPAHPKVQAAIEDAVARIIAAGKPAGVFAIDEAMADRFFARGCTYASVGADTRVLAKGLDALRRRFIPDA